MQRTLSDEDDSRLMGLASDGSEEAFLTLYRRHQRRVFRFALRMSGDEATAEEVVQEVFMMVVRAPERYDSVRASVGAWLLGIARNHVLRALERQSGHVAPVCDDGESAGDEVASESPDVLRNLIERETRETLRAAILTLPAPYREALVLCDLEELDYIDAARVTGCSVGTIRSRLHRARNLLAAKVGAAKRRGCAV